ncbi:17457_t:CDS:2 [Racocetra fulgida]|uniref:Large ribosomal subunit protein bL31c n=1 Tax=Racocetra fulgida TaxID=60492 RepID=A0A9N8VWG0_9GLOM|nr:17457_t:CDS:2 [Racocetra fulgida]
MELTLQFLPADKKKEAYQKLKESYKDTLVEDCCNQQYQTVSTVTNEIKIDSCRNCVYPGASIGLAKKGAVEKFRQRAQKVKLKKT